MNWLLKWRSVSVKTNTSSVTNEEIGYLLADILEP